MSAATGWPSSGTGLCFIVDSLVGLLLYSIADIAYMQPNPSRLKSGAIGDFYVLGISRRAAHTAIQRFIDCGDRAR